MASQTFDVAGARKAGFSDDDILNELASTHNYDAQGALKAGFSKQDIINELSAQPVPSKAPFDSKMWPGRSAPLGNQRTDFNRTFTATPTVERPATLPERLVSEQKEQVRGPKLVITPQGVKSVPQTTTLAPTAQMRQPAMPERTLEDRISTSLPFGPNDIIDESGRQYGLAPNDPELLAMKERAAQQTEQAQSVMQDQLEHPVKMGVEAGGNLLVPGIGTAARYGAQTITGPSEAHDPSRLQSAVIAANGALEAPSMMMGPDLLDAFVRQSMAAPILIGSGMITGPVARKAAEDAGWSPDMQDVAEQVATFAPGVFAGVVRRVGGAQGLRDLSKTAGEAIAKVTPDAIGTRMPEFMQTPGQLAKTEARQVAKQGANLASSLEMGGKADKGTMAYEEVALPIVDDFRAEAAAQGKDASSFSGRDGYKNAQEVTAGVRQKFDNAYNSLIEPIKGEYAGDASKKAALDTVNSLLSDASLLDEIQRGDPQARNVQQLQNIANSIANARTVGELDAARVALNQLASKYYGRSEAGQYGSPFVQEALAKGANAVRNALYEDIAQRYGGVTVNGESTGIPVEQIRELQKKHGAAIQADQLMQQTARQLSSISSAEEAKPAWWRVGARLGYRATMGSPQHAAAGVLERLLAGSDLSLFNKRMQRVVKGATPDMGTEVPVPPITPEYVEPSTIPDTRTSPVAPRLPAGPEELTPGASFGPPPAPGLPPAPEPNQLPPAGRGLTLPWGPRVNGRRALPAMSLPDTNATPVNVEAVGIPQTAEAQALETARLQGRGRSVIPGVRAQEAQPPAPPTAETQSPIPALRRRGLASQSEAPNTEEVQTAETPTTMTTVSPSRGAGDNSTQPRITPAGAKRRVVYDDAGNPHEVAPGEIVQIDAATGRRAIYRGEDTAKQGRARVELSGQSWAWVDKNGNVLREFTGYSMDDIGKWLSDTKGLPQDARLRRVDVQRTFDAKKIADNYDPRKDELDWGSMTPDQQQELHTELQRRGIERAILKVPGQTSQIDATTPPSRAGKTAQNAISAPSGEVAPKVSSEVPEALPAPKAQAQQPVESVEPSVQAQKQNNPSLSHAEALQDMHRTYGITESHVRNLVEQQGVTFNGIWDASASRNGLQVQVTDPQTGSTYSLPMDAVTDPAKFSEALAGKRGNFQANRTLLSEDGKPIDRTDEKALLRRARWELGNDASYDEVLRRVETLKNPKAPVEGAEPNYVYRVQDANADGIPLAAGKQHEGRAQAVSERSRAFEYASGRATDRAGTPDQELVRIDLNKLPSDDYVVRPLGDGVNWVKFTNNIPRANVESLGVVNPVEAQAAADAALRRHLESRGASPEAVTHVTSKSPEAKDIVASQLAEVQNVGHEGTGQVQEGSPRSPEGSNGVPSVAGERRGVESPREPGVSQAPPAREQQEAVAPAETPKVSSPLPGVRRGRRAKSSSPIPAVRAKAEASSEPMQTSTEPSPAKSVIPALRSQGSYTLADFDSFRKKLRSGEVSADEVRDNFRRVSENEAPIKAELSKMTVPELRKMSGSFYANTMKKDALVNNVFETLQQGHLAGKTLSYSMGFGDLSKANELRMNALNKSLSELTDADIQQYGSENKARTESFMKSVQNPETYDEFRRFIQYRGEDKLTPEQRIRWDEVRAQRNREQGESELERKATVQGANVGDVPLSYKTGTHTKTGETLHIVQMGTRVSPEAYKELNTKAKQLGGHYSSFIKADSGFQFKSKDAADKFMKVAKGESVSRLEQIQQHKAEVQDNAVSRLRNQADSLEAKADESLGRERLDNTARRAAMASNAEASARADKALAETMRNLANGIEEGNVTHLDGLRTKAHVEELNYELRSAQRRADSALKRRYDPDRPVERDDIEHAEYPYPWLTKSDLLKFSGELENKPGGLLLSKRLRKYAAMLGNDDVLNLRFNTADRLDDYRLLAKKVVGWDQKTLADRYESYARLQKMGIPDLPTLRAALREFFDYRGKRGQVDPLTKAKRDLVGRKFEGFFPTPEPLVNDLLDKADIRDGMSVLEPSAGWGNIADAVKAKYPESEVSTIEIQPALRNILELSGHKVVDWDFMEHKGTYDRIVMNPPFENGMDMEHVQHAYDLLNPGGRLVAIMSESPFSNGNGKAAKFREWLDSVGGESEKNPEGSFKDSERSTGVATRTVVIDKPAEKRAESPIPALRRQ